MNEFLQRLVQAVFLLLFAFAVFSGMIQLWLVVFLLGIAFTFLLGRGYCGWLCPINTVMKIVTFLKKKAGVKKQSSPAILSRDGVRYLILVLFLATFLFSMITGRQIPVLPALFAAGVILTLFFPEEFWHRYLCPYGTILRGPGSISRFKLNIDQDRCNGCGICKRVCPAAAVQSPAGIYSIKSRECLLGLDCSRRCPQKAIHYGKNSG